MWASSRNGRSSPAVLTIWREKAAVDIVCRGSIATINRRTKIDLHTVLCLLGKYDT